MAHFENIALAAIYDKDPKIRKWAFDKIRAAKRLEDPSNVRQFIKPKRLNWNAKHYTELYDPFSIDTVPPLIARFYKRWNENASKACNYWYRITNS